MTFVLADSGNPYSKAAALAGAWNTPPSLCLAESMSEEPTEPRTPVAVIAAAPELLADALALAVRRPGLDVTVLRDGASEDDASGDDASASETPGRTLPPPRPVDLLIVANMRVPPVPAELIVILEDHEYPAQALDPLAVTNRVAGRPPPASDIPTVVLQPGELQQLIGIIDSISGVTPPLRREPTLVRPKQTRVRREPT